MLKGYDQKKAVSFIRGRMNPEEYAALPWTEIPALLAQCIEADFKYMTSSGIMLKDGSDGEYYYNRTNARGFILSALLKKNSFTEKQAPEVSALVADYMDYNCSYMLLNGMGYHEDERIDMSQTYMYDYLD